MEPKISACLVVRNEEPVIERCLKSIKDVVDEIIVVHDGKCEDKTLEICKKYGAKIFVRKYSGNVEGHRVFTYKKAKGDWILQIDADEFLSTNARKNLRKLIKSNKADGYEFLWPHWDGKRYLTKKTPYKICLFKKEKLSFLGILQESPRIKGKVLKVNLKLEHKPTYNNFTFKNFITKYLKWIKIQADQLLKDFQKIPKFQYPNKTWPWHLKLIRNLNIIIAIPLFFYAFLFAFFRYFRKGENLIFILKICFISALYYFILALMVFYRKIRLALK